MDGCSTQPGPQEAKVARVQLVFDPSLEVDARAFAALWADDPEAKAVMDGQPEVRRDKPATYMPPMMELVVIPLAVNVASTVLVGLATRIYHKYRPDSDARAELTERSEDRRGDLTIAISAAPDAEPPA